MITPQLKKKKGGERQTFSGQKGYQIKAYCRARKEERRPSPGADRDKARVYEVTG